MIDRFSAPRIAAIAGLAAAFFGLGNLVAGSPPGAFDVAARPLAGHGVPAALFFTSAGRFPEFVVLSLVVLAVGFARRAFLVPAATAVVALALAWKTSDVLKDAFHRPRPDYWIAIQETSFSYASGHAALSLTFYGILAYAAWRMLPPSALRTGLVMAATLWILATGWSRLALGAHYATDVLGGYLLGGVFAVAGSLVIDRFGVRRPVAT